jgi:hypothetical protein
MMLSEGAAVMVAAAPTKSVNTLYFNRLNIICNLLHESLGCPRLDQSGALNAGAAERG